MDFLRWYWRKYVRPGLFGTVASCLFLAVTLISIYVFALYNEELVIAAVDMFYLIIVTFFFVMLTLAFYDETKDVIKKWHEEKRRNKLQQAPVVIGVDWWTHNSRSLTRICLMDNVGLTLLALDIKDSKELISKIRVLSEVNDVSSVWVDGCGIGSVIAERMQSEGLPARAINLTRKREEETYASFKEAVAKGDVVPPDNMTKESELAITIAWYGFNNRKLAQPILKEKWL